MLALVETCRGELAPAPPVPGPAPAGTSTRSNDVVLEHCITMSLCTSCTGAFCLVFCNVSKGYSTCAAKGGSTRGAKRVLSPARAQRAVAGARPRSEQARCHGRAYTRRTTATSRCHAPSRGGRVDRLCSYYARACAIRGRTPAAGWLAASTVSASSPLKLVASDPLLRDRARRLPV